MCKSASGELSSLLCDDLEGWDGGGEGRDKQEKGAAADEIVREHHQLNGREFEHTLGNSGGQRSLTCCS